MLSILCVIPYRFQNVQRDQNIKMTLNWLLDVKKRLELSIVLDLMVVEQDTTRRLNDLPTDVSYLFIENSGLFNKGWAFNVAIKDGVLKQSQKNKNTYIVLDSDPLKEKFPYSPKYIPYSYFLLADGDVVFPDTDAYCEQLISCCLRTPKSAFRLFDECFDTVENDIKQCSSVFDVINLYHLKNLKLKLRYGTTFAGGHIAISKSTFDKIGGCDEQFEGWGREDDFLTHKLVKIASCKNWNAPLKAIHLWHPIGGSLQQKTIDLYDKLVKLPLSELTNHINTSAPKHGNPLKYSHSPLLKQ